MKACTKALPRVFVCNSWQLPLLSDDFSCNRYQSWQLICALSIISDHRHLILLPFDDICVLYFFKPSTASQVHWAYTRHCAYWNLCSSHFLLDFNVVRSCLTLPCNISVHGPNIGPMILDLPVFNNTIPDISTSHVNRIRELPLHFPSFDLNTIY